jgi:hypothetical protein
MNKAMVIDYDWRNLPRTFIFLNDIPQTFLQGHQIAEGQNLLNGIYCPTSSQDFFNLVLNETKNTQSGMQILSTVNMLYDAAGQRVVKIEK